MPGPEGAQQAACAIHPERQAVATCSRCGTFSCEECLSQSPRGEILCARCMARTAISQLPWDHRKELGLVRAWLKSVSAILLRPGITFSTARPAGDVGGSFLFAALCWFVGGFTTFMTFILLGALLPFMGEDTESVAPLQLLIIGTYGGMLVVTPVFGIISTVILAALDHLVLMMFGRPRGFEATLRGASLSLAPYVLGVIPICGLYIAPIWVLMVKVFAYKGLHRTTTGVALVGALAIPALLLLLSCGLYALVFLFALSGGPPR